MRLVSSVAVHRVKIADTRSAEEEAFTLWRASATLTDIRVARRSPRTSTGVLLYFTFTQKPSNNFHRRRKSRGGGGRPFDPPRVQGNLTGVVDFCAHVLCIFSVASALPFAGLPLTKRSKKSRRCISISIRRCSAANSSISFQGFHHPPRFSGILLNPRGRSSPRGIPPQRPCTLAILE